MDFRFLASELESVSVTCQICVSDMFVPDVALITRMINPLFCVGTGTRFGIHKSNDQSFVLVPEVLQKHV